jgi:hypothetical protein
MKKQQPATDSPAPVSDRDKALAWWEGLTNSEAHGLLFKYPLKEDVNQIENIWRQEVGGEKEWEEAVSNSLHKLATKKAEPKEERHTEDSFETYANIISESDADRAQRWEFECKKSDKARLVLISEHEALKQSNKDLLEALEGIVNNWDEQLAPAKEVYKEPKGEFPGYWSPSGCIISSQHIAKAREVITKAQSKQ